MEDFLSDYKPAVIMPAKKQSLYDIRAEHLALLDEIEQNEGELTPDLEQALSLTNEQFQEKAVSYGFVIKHFNNDLDILSAEIIRLGKLQDEAMKRRELFKQRLSDAMQAFGFEKITTPLLTLSFRKSESVRILSENDVPPEFKPMKWTCAPDKAAIKEAIKSGHDVPGAQLVVKQNLQIK